MSGYDFSVRGCRRVLLVSAAVLAACALGPQAVVAPAAAKSCEPGQYPGSGYFTSLEVARVGCGKGRAVARAHYRCRTRKGGRKGRCGSRVKGYRCSEERQTIPTEINAVVRCRRGSRRVTFSYQQNT